MKLPVLLLGVLATSRLFAAEVRDTTLDKKTRDETLAAALSFIANEYVFPDKTKQLVQAIRERQQHGVYDKITSALKLAETLTHDLRAAAHDVHFAVLYSEAPLPRDPPPDSHPSRETLEHARAEDALDNFGFSKVEIRHGNIGYVRLDRFATARNGGDTAAATMAFVANSDALIFDLRENQGGDPTMVQLLAGYLFDGEPVRLSDIVYRDAGDTEQFPSNAWVPGKRYLDKPVFVLLSSITGSCAEAFAYDLQALKRVTTVGEATVGGAHPVNEHRLSAHLSIMVPYARALNPITHGEWEGKGVQPDVPVAADKALAKATMLAAQRIAQHPRDPRHVELLQRVVKEAEATLRN
jgi:hypothetical protein